MNAVKDKPSTEFAICFLATLSVLSVCLNILLIAERTHPHLWTDVRRMFIRPPTPVSSDYQQGASNPAITIIDYSDFQCPYSKQIHAFLSRLMQSPAQISVKWIYRNRPLESVHPFAMAAAVAADCAGLQGKFWKYSDLVFQNQDMLAKDSTLDNLAATLDMNMDMFRKCRQVGAGERLKMQLAEANRLEIDSTPTLFINGKRFDGVLQYEQLIDLVASAR